MQVPTLAPVLDAPGQPDACRAILREVFGYGQFRGPQKAIIEHVVAGGDALVLMPTGGGKSLCYQIPAIARQQAGHGITVVISPLIALMHDQVGALHEAGVSAAFLNSTLSGEEAADVERRLLRGDITLLYAAPERVTTPRFLAQLDSLHERGQLSLFAIDEAHCVSQWGHDFRPEYRALTVLHERYATVPRIALTATADALTRADILERLQLQDARAFVSSFDRTSATPSSKRKTPRSNCCASSRASTGATPALSIASRANAWKRLRKPCATKVLTPCRTTPGWTHRCARPIRTVFCAARAL